MAMSWREPSAYHRGYTAGLNPSLARQARFDALVYYTLRRFVFPHDWKRPSLSVDVGKPPTQDVIHLWG